MVKIDYLICFSALSIYTLKDAHRLLIRKYAS